MITRPKGESLIIGVELGELHVNHTGQSITIQGVFALVREDGARCGRYTQHIWSEETNEKARAFFEQLEKDAAGELFDQRSSGDEETPPAEQV